MTRTLTASVLLILAIVSPLASQRYDVKGMVLHVDPAHRQFTASIEAIPGFIKAMVMPFDVAQRSDLHNLSPGVIVEFVLVVDGRSSRAEHLRVSPYVPTDQDPFTADRLRLLNQISSSSRAAAPRLGIGQTVPDFTLIDQGREPLTLSHLRGKVVAINFVYTSCPLPNYCLRIANNFSALQQRFKNEVGREFVMLTVTFDPIHDDPHVLEQYSAQWHADRAHWHFLTGMVADVTRVCAMFGVSAFSDEGLMNHSLHTALIDRRGRLVANLEGNQFSSTQLGDLLATELRR